MSALADRVGRWIRQAALGRRIAIRAGAAYIRLVHATTRWQIEGGQHLEAALAERRALLASIWHGRLFLSPLWAQPGRRTYAVISNNRDGDVIAGIAARFGVEAIRGSSHDRAKRRGKGGRAVLSEGLRALADPVAVVAITPDGPRGPRMRAQDGVANLAIMTGATVIPVSFSTRRAIVMRTWDRFFVPLPFGRGVQIYGAPIRPPERRTPEGVAALRAEIEAAQTAITERADRLCGRDPVTAGAAAQ